jgi:hypothetical protein
MTMQVVTACGSRNERGGDEPRNAQREWGGLIASRQIKGTRALLGWCLADSENRSGVSAPAIAPLVDGNLGGRTGLKIRNALEAEGIQFIEKMGEERGCGFENLASVNRCKLQVRGWGSNL